MLSKLLGDVSLFSILYHIDQDLTAESRQAGCPYCGGPLHSGRYLRKPRGGPEKIPEECRYRLSLCCGRKGCRRRVLPKSCLFMDRRVYWRAVILVVVTLRRQRPNGSSANRLMRLFSIPRKTIVRWCAYFRDVFPRSAQWQGLRGLVSASVAAADQPGALCEHFLQCISPPAEALTRCLRFLAAGGQVT